MEEVIIEKVSQSDEIKAILNRLLIENAKAIEKREKVVNGLVKDKREKKIEEGDFVGSSAPDDCCLGILNENKRKIETALEMLENGTFGTCSKCYKETLAPHTIEAILKSNSPNDWSLLYMRTLCLVCSNGQKTFVGFCGGPRNYPSKQTVTRSRR